MSPGTRRCWPPPVRWEWAAASLHPSEVGAVRPPGAPWPRRLCSDLTRCSPCRPHPQACCSASRSPPPSSPFGTTGGASSRPPSAPSSSGSWPSGTAMKVEEPGSRRRAAPERARAGPGRHGCLPPPLCLPLRDHHGPLQNTLPPGLPLRPAGAAGLRCHRVSSRGSRGRAGVREGRRRFTAALLPSAALPVALGARSSST